MRTVNISLGIVAIGLALTFLILAVPQSSGDDGVFIADNEDIVGHWYLAYVSRYSPNDGYTVRTVESYPDIGSGDLDIIEIRDNVLHGRLNNDYITGVYDMGRLRIYGQEWIDMSTGMFREDGTMVLSTAGSTDGIGWSSLRVFTKSVDRSMVSVPESIDVTGVWAGKPTFCTNGVFGTVDLTVQVKLQNGNHFDVLLSTDNYDYITAGVIYNLAGNRMVGRISCDSEHSLEFEIVSGDMLVSHTGTKLETGLPFCSTGSLSRGVPSQVDTDNGLDHTIWKCTSSFSMDGQGKISNDLRLYSIELHANVNGVTIGTWTYGSESLPISAHIDSKVGSTNIRVAWMQDGVETKCVGNMNEGGDEMVLYEFKTVDGISTVNKSILTLSSHIIVPDILGHWYVSHTTGYIDDAYHMWDAMKDADSELYCDFDIYKIDDGTIYGMRDGTPFVGYYSDGMLSIISTHEASRDITMGWIENDGTLTTMNTFISHSGSYYASYSTFTKIRGVSSILDGDIDLVGTWFVEEPVRIDSDGTLTRLHGKNMEITETHNGAFKGTMEQDIDGAVETVPIRGIVIITTWGYSRGVMIDDNDRVWGINMNYGVMSMSCISGYDPTKPSYSIQKNYIRADDDDSVDSDVGVNDKTVWRSSEATLMRDDGTSFLLDVDVLLYVDISYGNCYAGRLVCNGSEYSMAGYTTSIGDQTVTRMVVNTSEYSYGLGFGVYHGGSIDFTITYDDGMQRIVYCILERATGATS